MVWHVKGTTEVPVRPRVLPSINSVGLELFCLASVLQQLIRTAHWLWHLMSVHAVITNKYMNE
jgi:hypothetical protein